MNNNYTADSIRKLSDISHIQERKGMYIGEATDPSALFSEILDNSVDELQLGYSAKIDIKVNTKDNVYIIRDYGRGIPHGKKIVESGKEVEVLELLITESNSGGKFDHNAYKRSTGLHGVGLTVTNALSHYIIIRTYRDHKCVEAITNHGLLKELNYLESSEDDGTYVEFNPSEDYFETSIIPIDYIMSRCKILKAFGYNINLTIDEKDITFDDVSSLYDLMPKNDSLKNYCKLEINYTSSNDEDIKVIIDYNSGTHYHCDGYTNMIYNKSGGTHNRMIYRTICDAWSEFNNEISTPLEYDDCTLGLNVLVAVFIGDTAFSSQTKERLTIPNDNLSELMIGFKSKFIEYLKDNPDLRKGLLKRFEEYRLSQNKLLSQKEIMNKVKLNESRDGQIKRHTVVPGLIECTSTSRDNTEIYYVEGYSAAGPVARARNRKTQSVLPLRGKIKNVTYMDIKEALKSDAVCSIVNSAGCGVGEQSDPSRSRYERFCIMTDGDADGAHIAALILSVFVNIIPNAVREGLVYIISSPLYGYDLNGKRYYCNDLNEIPENSSNFTRYKGLGEMDDTELRDSCLTPGQRTIYRVQYPEDLNKFNEILGSSSGRSDLLKEYNILVREEV